MAHDASKAVAFNAIAGGQTTYELFVEGTAEPDNVEITITNNGTESIESPWLWCDANIDCFSCRRIIEQIIPRDASDGQVIEAVVRFLEYHMLHTTGSTDRSLGYELHHLAGNTIYNLNSVGAGACSQFATAAIQLLDAAGWQGAAEGFSWGGHTVCMVAPAIRRRDGRIIGFDKRRWFMIDADGIRGPVYSQTGSGELAELAELEENRSNNIVLGCAMGNGRLASGLAAARYAEMVNSLDDNRFSDDARRFHIREGHTMAFVLRPFESLIRPFRNVGARTFVNGRSRVLVCGQACHMYGTDDGVYPRPEIELPHVYGNGILRYNPSLGQEHIRRTLDQGIGLAAAGGLGFTVEPHGVGEWRYNVALPYGIVGARVALETTHPAHVEVGIACGPEGRWHTADLTRTPGRVQADLTAAFAQLAYFDYRLRIRLKHDAPDQCPVVTFLCVDTVFLCNPRSLPHLERGENRIHYCDASASATPRRIEIAYRFAERSCTVDAMRSEVLVLSGKSRWDAHTWAYANRNGFALVLVALLDDRGLPAEGCKVLLESNRPHEDVIVPDASYTAVCSLFDHDPIFGEKGTLNLNTMSAPVVTINNGATLRIPSENYGLHDATGREYLGTRLFRVYSKTPGTSVLKAILSDGTAVRNTAQIRFV